MTVEVAVTLLSIITVAQGVFLVVLYRQVGLSLLKRGEAIIRDGPEAGTRLPAALIAAAEDYGIVLRSEGGPWSTLLIIFARQACHLCVALWPELNRFMALRPDVAVLIVLSSEPKTAADYRVKHTLHTPVVPDPKERLFAAGRVRVSPFAVATDATYTVRRKGLVNNQDHLKLLAGIHDSRGVDESSVPFTNGRTNAVELVR